MLSIKSCASWRRAGQPRRPWAQRRAGSKRRSIVESAAPLVLVVVGGPGSVGLFSRYARVVFVFAKSLRALLRICR